MNNTPAVKIESLSHRYGDRLALDNVSLSVESGEIFGFLGPNGSGKTTLFRILSTLIDPQSGSARIFDMTLPASRDQVRRMIGVVFQSPSLDKQLTARENLMHQGHLYGLRGKVLNDRIDSLLNQFSLTDRAHERVEHFSGGMRRRVEIAKGLLHQPKILLMDEPSTGLDPRARLDLWQQLHQIQKSENTTILLTTHLMDEADQCHRLAILDQAKLIVLDSPTGLKDRIGGDVINLTTTQPEQITQILRDRLGVHISVQVGNTIRIERPDGHEFVPRLIAACPPGVIDSVSVGKPTLEDVFIHLTGHEFVQS